MAELRDRTQLLSPPLLRWSSVRNCPRLAVYEATKAPARDRTLREDRWLFRGKQVGQGFVVALASENRWKVFVASGPDFLLPYPHLRAESADAADAVAELKVQWELGVGHADLFVKETNSILEVLSSQNASGDMVESKLIQARGYAEAKGATSIALAIVDPSTLEEDRLIVTAGTARWDELGAACDERIAQVIQWRDTGEMPARVCQKPGDAWGHFCLHAAHCFEGYEPPDTPVFDGDLERAQELAIRLAHAKAKRRELTQADKLFEAEQREIQAEFADVFDYGEQIVGGYRVKRAARATRSFKLAVAEKDSRIPDSLLDEFTSTTPWDAWDVEKVGAAVTVDDDEAPF